MNLTNKDMQFLEYQRWLLCKIMIVYAMQPVVLGVIDPTTGKLNSEQQLQAYREEAVRPLLELESYQLTKVLVQQGFGFDDIKIDYEPINIEDEVVNADIAVKSVTAGILTPNEARRMYFGLGKIEGGDTLLGQQGQGLALSEVVKKLKNL
jgi:phage portal protein BeeE